MSRSARLRREALLVMLGQAGASLMGLVGLRLLTTLLSPADFGRLALGLSITAFMQQIAFGPISAATLRYAGSAQAEGALLHFEPALAGLLRHALVLSAAVACLLCLGLWITGAHAWIGLTVASLWFAGASGLSTALLFVDVSLRRRGRAAVVQVGTEVLRFGAAAALLVAVPQTAAVGTMLAFAGVVTTIALVQSRTFRSGTPAERVRSGAWRQQLEAFAAPLALTGALSWAQLASDRWSLNAFLSMADVGAYSALYQIAVAPMSLLSVMLQQLIGPVVFRIAGRAQDEQQARDSHRVVFIALLALAATTMIGVALTWWLHAMIFTIVVGPEFRHYSAMLPLAVFVGGMLAASQLAATMVMSRGDTRRLIRPKVVTAVVGIALNVAGARTLGVQGVLLANATYGALYLMSMLVLARQPAKAGLEAHT